MIYYVEKEGKRKRTRPTAVIGKKCLGARRAGETLGDSHILLRAQLDAVLFLEVSAAGKKENRPFARSSLRTMT